MNFITFRRHYLDKVLLETIFYGKVLDVGGKKDNKRGKFRPPLKDVESWKYLNIDKSTNPDYYCSADNIPVEASTFDVILMAEVIEHLENPLSVLEECYRVLSRDGMFVATIPFLNGIHADPYDFQRWTNVKIQLELKKLGFKEVRIEPMGSLFAVIYDLLYSGLTLSSKNEQSFRNRFIRKFIFPFIRSIFLILDKKYAYKSKNITTGYYIEAKK
jgi:ubiquinone/menaquinone biosynthesis C-methylase UbiE